MPILCRLVIAAMALWCGCGSAAQAEPLRIGYLTWVGLGPLFVAQEKGLFAEEGVEVELINMAIHEAMYAGLFAGQIDVIDATVDDMLPQFRPGAALCAACWRSTELLGGDGILATQGHPARSPTSRVRRWRSPSARCRSSIVNVLLREAGLSEADIEDRRA